MSEQSVLSSDNAPVAGACYVTQAQAQGHFP
jgi:hypothetical protein